MLTPLEKAVLDLQLDEHGEPFDTIRQQLAHAIITSRRFTGVGFFTDFIVPENSPVRRDLPDLTLGDVEAELPGVHLGAGFLLFIRGGTVSMLEGYTYDDPWPTSTEEFRVYRHEGQ